MTDKKFEWEMDYSRTEPETGSPVPPDASSGKSADPLVGQILDGRFLIQQDLTEGGGDAGGIGLVYLALDMKLMGKQTVVKILRKTVLQNEDIVRKFLHEKEALIRLDHPNIVRILDSGELSDGNPFLVMECIPGYSLRRVLKTSGKQPFDFVAHIIEAVTDALSAAHSQKILHRDIKPENIMLTPHEDDHPRVRLIDFGIARVEDSRLAPATEIPRGIGTILYIAPEQLLGKMEQTPAVDIYAFAIVIYEMLTGELPFKPQSVVEMFELQKEPISVLPSQLREELPAEAERLLLSALAFDPLERPQNARLFGRRLAAALRNVSYVTDSSVPPGLAETVASPVVREQVIIDIPPNPSCITIESAPERKVENPAEPIRFIKRKTPGRIFLAGSGAALLLLAASFLGAIAYWGGSGRLAVVSTPRPTATLADVSPKFDTNTDVNQTSSTATTDLPIEVRYHLIVQKMRNGLSFEEPFRSSGQEIFENGYKFKMVFQAANDGYLYLLNQDRDQRGNRIYNLLYPTPKINNGSAQIFVTAPAETSFNTFSGDRGTEIIWLIWTAERNNDLETIKETALIEDGVVSSEKSVTLINGFLQTHQDQKKESRKDSAAQETIIKATGRVLVHAVELEHR